jgi:hypothetical protein
MANQRNDNGRQRSCKAEKQKAALDEPSGWTIGLPAITVGASDGDPTSCLLLRSSSGSDVPGLLCFWLALAIRTGNAATVCAVVLGSLVAPQWR